MPRYRVTLHEAVGEGEEREFSLGIMRVLKLKKGVPVEVELTEVQAGPDGLAKYADIEPVEQQKTTKRATRALSEEG